ncbi:aminoglycoside phosphotransferase family protein [Streptomyces brasiliensis]|uniref:Phosphotransferase n=1 Tax=Streptomyces brasiliensis TaxID=1954 RepID=A0A917NFI8_9ACTN|nr:aminoglycoside phosphotransferase family protein [Streptomyces brasiliensis]GGI95916.1 phosphotransferase [Streptomyces brasiliensis]
MLHETTVTVDRGQYPDAVTPWERETWRNEALDWVAGELAARGLRTTGTLRVRLRPWSVLARVPVEGRDTVWFKANPPASAFEGALTAALARWVPESVLEPLAVDAGRGWSLLPDGGELFRDALRRVPVDVGEWEELLRQYACVQRALVPHTHEIEELGVPTVHTLALPEAFDRLVERNTVLRPDERAKLVALRPRLVDWCAELAATGVPDTLDHADLHDGQLFRSAPDRFVFFDWGDAVVSHPFCSLLVPARRACEHYGDEVLPRLRDAYLEPWTGEDRTRAQLRRAVSLAWRLGALGRAASWGRLFPSAAGAAGGDVDGADWLLRLLTDPPL